MINNKVLLTSKLSLSFLWIITGLISIVLNPSIGFEVLAKAGIVGQLANFCVYAGGSLDILLGVWILTSWKLKLCYIAQIVTIIVFTFLMTIIAPEFWLHPFGPATKNLPILALIFTLYFQDEK